MEYLEVDIIEYRQSDFPGWVLCKTIDSTGKTHYFEEKIPIISIENINKDTILPRKGYVKGEITNKNDGIICFSTSKPDDVETKEGVSIFYVYENQIIK
jgi:hypothetical protein